MNILFLGVGRRIELLQAFRNASIALNKRIVIYGEDICDTAPALAFCDKRFRLCKIRDERYIDELLEKSVQEQIDIIIPTIDTNLLVLAQNKDRFETEGIKVLISSQEMVRICRDKNETSQFFIECGLHAPMSVNNWHEYRGGFPAFIKPKDGSSSINTYKIEDEQELENYVRRVAEYVVQPFIDGTEYTIDIFCDWYGKPISIVPRERLQVRAGEVLKTKICMDEMMIAEAKTLCERLIPCGPITVQLIRDNQGVDWFIEINPRFGGGAPLSMKAGARSAEIILRLLDGEKVKYCSNIGNGAIYSRFDQSVCITEWKSEIKGVIFDLDDTLYNEKEYVKSGYKAVAEYLGDVSIADRLWKEFISGKSAFDEVLNQLKKMDDLQKCIRIYQEHKPTLNLNDGAKELVKSLKERNIKIGIITDGRPNGQRNKIEALGLSGLDYIITDELGGIQFRKPCDIAFRHFGK